MPQTSKRSNISNGSNIPGPPPSAASTVSVVVPCFNEEENLPLFYERFVRVALDMANQYRGLYFELIFVDDGSTDDTLP